MTFDPNRFLGLERELAGNSDDEARLRTAVGRAYYSVFLQARELRGIRERRRVHGLVIGRLGSVDFKGISIKPTITGGRPYGVEGRGGRCLNDCQFLAANLLFLNPGSRDWFMPLLKET
jgi:hypothetical protein